MDEGLYSPTTAIAPVRRGRRYVCSENLGRGSERGRNACKILRNQSQLEQKAGERIKEYQWYSQEQHGSGTASSSATRTHPASQPVVGTYSVRPSVFAC